MERPPPECDSTREEKCVRPEPPDGKKSRYQVCTEGSSQKPWVSEPPFGYFRAAPKVPRPQAKPPQQTTIQTAGKFGRGKAPPLGAPRAAAVNETVSLIRPSVRTGAPSPRGRLKEETPPQTTKKSGGVGREKHGATPTRVRQHAGDECVRPGPPDGLQSRHQITTEGSSQKPWVSEPLFGYFCADTKVPRPQAKHPQPDYHRATGKFRRDPPHYPNGQKRSPSLPTGTTKS